MTPFSLMYKLIDVSVKLTASIFRLHEWHTDYSVSSHGRFQLSAHVPFVAEVRVDRNVSNYVHMTCSCVPYG
jgi:hypothetical protein